MLSQSKDSYSRAPHCSCFSVPQRYSIQLTRVYYLQTPDRPSARTVVLERSPSPDRRLESSRPLCLTFNRVFRRAPRPIPRTRHSNGHGHRCLHLFPETSCGDTAQDLAILLAFSWSHQHCATLPRLLPS